MCAVYLLSESGPEDVEDELCYECVLLQHRGSKRLSDRGAEVVRGGLAGLSIMGCQGNCRVYLMVNLLYKLSIASSPGSFNLFPIW